MTTISLERISIDAMPDRELLKRLVRVADTERHLTADVLALLGECDARRLYLGEGCSSLFTYCTQVLHFSEHAAYHRIEAARAARQFPVILDLVENGSVTLTTVSLLRPHLTPGNHRDLLAAARHRTKREVEYQIACLAPKPDVQTVIRRLPTQAVSNLYPATTPTAAAAPTPALTPALTPAPLQSARDDKSAASPTVASAPQLLLDDSAPSETSTSGRPGRHAVSPPVGDDSARHPPLPHSPPAGAEPRTQLAPLAADRYLLRVTLSAETHAMLRRAQQLMRHRASDGDPHAIIGRALSLLVEHLERAKFARVRRPRVTSDRTTSSIGSASSTSASSSPSAASSPSASSNTTAPSIRSAPPSASASASASGSRHIPAAMRRYVWARDEGRCAFVGAHGRCTETGRLEFHHVVPFARGGPTNVENLALRCRAHNAYESDQAFGPRVQRGSGLATDTGLVNEAPD